MLFHLVKKTITGFSYRASREKWLLYKIRERDKLSRIFSYVKKGALSFSEYVYYNGIIITSVYDNFMPEASGLA